MAKQQKGANNQENQSEGLLVGAAKAIGGLAGKVAAAVGHSAMPEGQQTEAHGSPARPGKLPKKNKHRLPRRQKKAMKKAGTYPAAV